MSFTHLFTPHTIRNLEIRNRIFSTGHQTIMAGSDYDDIMHESIRLPHTAGANIGMRFRLVVTGRSRFRYWELAWARLFEFSAK